MNQTLVTIPSMTYDQSNMYTLIHETQKGNTTHFNIVSKYFSKRIATVLTVFECHKGTDANF